VQAIRAIDSFEFGGPGTVTAELAGRLHDLVTEALQAD